MMKKSTKEKLVFSFFLFKLLLCIDRFFFFFFFLTSSSSNVIRELEMRQKEGRKSLQNLPADVRVIVQSID